MIVYRLSKAKYKNDLSGKGAELAGGRWNSKAVPILYTSESRALCTAEIAVHSPLGTIPSDYWIISIEIPDNVEISEIDPSTLPEDWDVAPHTNATQLIGDKFVSQGKTLVLKVPSAVVQGDFNYLINPAHSLFPLVRMIDSEIFEFDKRLFDR